MPRITKAGQRKVRKMKTLKTLAIAAALAAAITPAKADKASDLAVMLFYHDECANVLTPAELAYFKRVVAEAPSSSNPQRIVDNGLTMWRGKLNYCACLLYTSPSPRD